jgi:hypothetical protein
MTSPNSKNRKNAGTEKRVVLKSLQSYFSKLLATKHRQLKRGVRNAYFQNKRRRWNPPGKRFDYGLAVLFFMSAIAYFVG